MFKVVSRYVTPMSLAVNVGLLAVGALPTIQLEALQTPGVPERMHDHFSTGLIVDVSWFHLISP